MCRQCRSLTDEYEARKALHRLASLWCAPPAQRQHWDSVDGDAGRNEQPQWLQQETRPGRRDRGRH